MLTDGSIKNKSKFYRYARFYSVNEVIEWLRRMEYNNIKICQTIFKNPEEIGAIEQIKEGYGEGGFVVISSQKEMCHEQVKSCFAVDCMLRKVEYAILIDRR